MINVVKGDCASQCLEFRVYMLMCPCFLFFVQNYFHAQSRNTHLNYEVKQLRKRKDALLKQFNDHVPHCHQLKSQAILYRNSSHALLTADTSGYQSFYVTNLVNNRSVVSLVTPSNDSVTPVLATPVDSSFETGDARVVKREMVEEEYAPSQNSTSNEAADNVSDEGSIVMEVENEGEAVDELDDQSSALENCSPESRSGIVTELVQVTALQDASSESTTLELLTVVAPSFNEPERQQDQVLLSHRMNTQHIASTDVCVNNLPLAVTALSADED